MSDDENSQKEIISDDDAEIINPIMHDIIIGIIGIIELIIIIFVCQMKTLMLLQNF